MEPPTKGRTPLSTIAFTPKEDEEAEDSPPRRGRLVKRRSPEPDARIGGGYRSSSSPSPSKPRTRKAFDVLAKNAQTLKPLKAPQFGPPKKRLAKSEFVEREAVESDEEAGYGFGALKRKDDEEDLDGEDQDATLHELMDDRVMDAETLNEEKVLEKVQSVSGILSA